MPTHTVLQGDFLQQKLHPPVQIFCFDPPFGEHDSPLDFNQAISFAESIFTWIDSNRADDAVLVLFGRDRKGHEFEKSTVFAFTAYKFGWRVVRRFAWLSGASDFHRARYSAMPVWVMKKGNRTMNKFAGYRYLDVVKAMDDFRTDRMIMATPTAIAFGMLELVAKQGDIVCDPFAGTGSAMKAAKLCGIGSVSIELDQQRAVDLVELATHSKNEEPDCEQYKIATWCGREGWNYRQIRNVLTKLGFEVDKESTMRAIKDGVGLSLSGCDLDNELVKTLYSLL